MSQAASPARQFYSVAPLFLVADIVTAAAYYTDVLGFTVARLWGEPPRFGIASRDGVRIMLSQVDDRAYIHPHGAELDIDDPLDAYIWVRDVDALFAEMKARGADIIFGPVDKPLYGLRELAVQDPDGYVLVFAHDISGQG